MQNNLPFDIIVPFVNMKIKAKNMKLIILFISNRRKESKQVINKKLIKGKCHYFYMEFIFSIIRQMAKANILGLGVYRLLFY
jgi:hypothetical protein